MKYTSLSPEQLLKICATADEAEAWEEFAQRFHAAIAGTVVQCSRRWSELSRAVHEELVQEAYFKLYRERRSILRRLAELPAPAISAFMKVIAANVVNDYFRALHAGKRKPPDGLLEFDDERAGSTGYTEKAAVEREVLLGRIDDVLESRAGSAAVEQGPADLLVSLSPRDDRA